MPRQDGREPPHRKMLEAFKTVFAELAEKVPAARTANPKEFVDTRFLEEFDRSGFIDGLYK